MKIATPIFQSSLEAAAASVISEMNIPIVEYSLKDIRKNTKDGVYACFHVGTNNFYKSPEIKDYENEIIDYASAVGLRFVDEITEIIHNSSGPRNDMHFDIVMLKVEGGKIIKKKMIEITGDQHMKPCFGSTRTSESIISDALKTSLWDTEIILPNDVKFDVLKAILDFLKA